MRRLFFVALLIVPFLFSCSKKTIIRNYYLLELPQSVNITADSTASPFMVNVDIRDFSVAKAFEQTRIALRTESNELNYFYYHHWAVRPSYAIADLVFRVFDQLGMFQRTVRGFSYNPDYLIRGTVESIERYQAGKNPAAHLAMSLQLVDAETEVTLVRHHFDRIEELKKDKSMNAFAQKLSEMLYQECDVFASKVKNHLAGEAE